MIKLIITWIVYAWTPKIGSTEIVYTRNVTYKTQSMPYNLYNEIDLADRFFCGLADQYKRQDFNQMTIDSIKIQVVKSKQ